MSIDNFTGKAEAYAFDQNSIKGILRVERLTVVYHQKINDIL